MKTLFFMKQALLIFYFLFFILANSAHAASPTTSPDKVQSQIDELKDRIASRVAELKLVEKRGIIGTVSDISNTQITLTDVKGDTRFVDVDELTKFEGATRDESFGISDIKKGSALGVLGLYNKQSRRLLARVIDVATAPQFIHGAVTSLDSENFSLTVVSDKNDKAIVDIEATTKTFSYTKVQGITRAGFSKIKESQNITVVGFPDKQNKDRVVASRILIFPDIPKNPKIVLPETPIPTIVPSTGSGKKLTPIVK